jgi:hypothetical protein
MVVQQYLRRGSQLVQSDHAAILSGGRPRADLP